MYRSSINSEINVPFFSHTTVYMNVHLYGLTAGNVVLTGLTNDESNRKFNVLPCLHCFQLGSSYIHVTEAACSASSITICMRSE